MLEGFSGLGMHLGNLWRLSPAKTRSISAENFTGEKGQGARAIEGTGAILGMAPGAAGKSRLRSKLRRARIAFSATSRVQALSSKSGVSSPMCAGAI
jgi:hypothetical protein